MVTSSLRLNWLPDPIRLVQDVDWTEPRTFEEALSAARRLQPNSALLLGIALTETLPVDATSRFLDALGGRRLTREQFEQLYEVWLQVDPVKASRSLVDLAESKRVSPKEEWVGVGLRFALEVGSRGGQLAALKLLVQVAREERRTDELLALLDAVALQFEAPDMTKAIDAVLEAVVGTCSEGDADIVAGRVLEAFERGVEDATRSSDLLRPILAWLSDDLRLAASELLRPRPGTVVHAQPLPTAVTTASEALRVASSAHGALIVLDEASELARRWSRAGITKLYRGLQALGEVADRWNAGLLDGDFEREFEKLPFEFKRDVSETAKTKFRDLYARTLPDGRRILLGPHIAVGNKSHLLRVYFYLDRDHREVVVGHVGDHLPDKTSG